MKMMNISARLLLLIAAAALLLMCAACGEAADVPQQVATEPEAVVEPLVLQQRSLLMNVGDQVTLNVTGGDEITYVSSDPAVVSVENGVVKAMKKGNALITVSSGEDAVYCGVMVEPCGQMLDVSNMKTSVVFSNVQLFHPMKIVGFAADPAGNAFYFSQMYGNSAYRALASDSMVTKVEKVDGVWQRTEYMHLFNHGGGYLGLETEGSDVYLLTESNGVQAIGGSTISRVKWENKKMCDETFGDTYELSELTGYLRPQTDVENDILAVYAFNGRDSYYAIYDRDAFFSGEQTHYLRTVACVKNQTPVYGEDASRGAYNASIRGFAIRDGYIYQLSGSACMYLSVFDMDGKLQYCRELEVVEGLSNPAAASLAFGADGCLYLAVNTNENANLYYANVWKLEEVK